MMQVKHLMTAAVTCGTSASMESVMRAMFDYDCRRLVVVDESGRLAGLLTEDDLCRAITMYGVAIRRRTVKDVIGSRVFSCSPNDVIESAIDLMQDLHLSSLPVTDTHGRPVGVLSLDEVLPEPDFSENSHFDREANCTFATICDSHPH
jgi:CBS domain-containing protein